MSQDQEQAAADLAAEWTARAGGQLVVVFTAAEPVYAGQRVAPDGEVAVRPDRAGPREALHQAQAGELVATAAAPPLLQPHEGMRGIGVPGCLLGLGDDALLHREALIAAARHLHTATLVGNPAPVVRRMAGRLRSPEPLDLAVAVEVLHGRPDPDSRLKGFGLFLGERDEWACDDAEWAAYQEAEPQDAAYGRPAERVFYLQYGPDPGDVCRWVNSQAVGLPVAVADFAADAAASRTATGATFTRDSLIGGLADSGFHLLGEMPSGPAAADGLAGRDGEVVARLRGLVHADWDGEGAATIAAAVRDLLWGER